MTPSPLPLAAIIIPARYGSTRFPGKPLARQTGKFLIQHVVEQAQKSTRAAHILVATDDHRIFDAVKSFGGHPIMTSDSHHSGTDRIAEVIRRPEFANVQIIVNVQGDEPDIDPTLIDDLIGHLTPRPGAPTTPLPAIATAATPFQHPRDIENPNLVKVVVDQNQCALYFSRAAIPFDRDRLMPGSPSVNIAKLYRRHLGIYAYSRPALLAVADAPPCDLERTEKLEQLRALYMGLKIYVAHTPHAPQGVDTPEDYAAFVKRYNHLQQPQSQPQPLASTP